MLVISAGYFLHDAVTCIRNYEDWGFAYLVHAISCCTLYRYGPNTLQGQRHNRHITCHVCRLQLRRGTESTVTSPRAERASARFTLRACVLAAMEQRQASCTISEQHSCYGNVQRRSVRAIAVSSA